VGLADAPICANACRHNIRETDILHALRNILAVNEYRRMMTRPVPRVGTAGQFIEVGVLNIEEGP
jgi:hypothetical protein